MDDSTQKAATADVHASNADVAAESEIRKKKPARKKRKALPGDDGGADQAPPKKSKKPKKKKDAKDGDGAARKKPRKQPRKAPIISGGVEELSAAQIAANEQMRKVLEEDCYSALGSIVESDSDDSSEYRGRGAARLDRAAILSAMRKRLWMERMGGNAVLTSQDEEEEDVDDTASRASRSARSKKKRKKTRRGREEESLAGTDSEAGGDSVAASEIMSLEEPREVDPERDEGSIFGATAGSSNATWVECDKCKKWRRLRGVIDEKKLPPKWYCSMNKNDPERARCSAPEEEYEQANTPESQADARTRKHLRIWVRRLQGNEAYEARQPTMTRGKKRNAAANSKEPYQWVRCCNPSCGKWRSLLRCMDAKTNVLDRTTNGLWYCVMNTWDEKIASCAAPQESLPALGCPPWVMED